MASPTWWTWVWASSGSWWWTGKPGVLQSMRSHRIGHDWAIELNWYIYVYIVVVQLLSRVQLFATPWTVAYQASLSFTISQSLLKLMFIESVMPSNYLILCRLLLLPSVFPRIRVFSNESALCIRWSKYWSFSISASNDYSGLISCRIDWFDLLAVQGTVKSFLQHHNLNASVLQCSPFLLSRSHLHSWLWEKT